MQASTVNKKRFAARGIRRRGSMLSMVALVGGIVLFTCVVGFAGYMLLAQQKRGQSDTDEVAINAAKMLNGDDRIGQMNNVVERCRELVYVSRVNKDLAEGLNTPLYQPLARQLLEESRANAALVEAERLNQINITTKTIQSYIQQHNVNTKTGSRLTLPWFQTNYPEVSDVYFGSIKGVQSNVENLQVIPTLRDYDLSQNYIQGGSNLYVGNINAKLPPPDSDLNFYLSSLPADVANSIAPVRLANPDVFDLGAVVIRGQKPTMERTVHLPGAIQLVQGMNVSGGENKASVRLSSTATADGGMPAPNANGVQSPNSSN
ncbi:MAG TPA: hypothetical protein V6C86_00915 [Oculatellaceae cyanobacterium]